MGSITEHQKIVDEILLAIGSRADGRAWKNVTGTARGWNGNVIAFGLKGSADVFAIKAPAGRLYCFEVKTGNATQSKEQKAFEKMITRFGGVYAVCKSVNDALTAFGVG